MKMRAGDGSVKDGYVKGVIQATIHSHRSPSLETTCASASEFAGAKTYFISLKIHKEPHQLEM